MELITAGVIAFAAGLQGSLVWATLKASRKRARVWREAAQACGLQDLAEIRKLGFSEGLRGRSGPLHVSVTYQKTGPLGRYPRGATVFEVDNFGPWRADLTLRPETATTRRAREKARRNAELSIWQADVMLRLRPPEREVEIGDLEFDNAFDISGPSVLARAVLDAETRRLLRTFPEPLHVLNGNLRAEVRGEVGQAGSFTTVLRLLLEAARRLTRPRDIAGRLGEIARNDSNNAVRFESLLALIREYPDQPATREVLRAACGDGSDMVRLRAAIALGEDGRDTLLDFVSREDLDDHSLAEAIEALGTHMPVERTKAILDRALRQRQLEVARACLVAIARSRGAGVVDLLAKVMRVEKGELAAAAAHALAETGLAAAEGPLADALVTGAAGVRVAAAEALGRVGSVGAVPGLKEAEERSDDGALARAARQAIAAIQARATGASPGQLSLATGEAGQLSLTADGASGQLSLAAEDGRGRLSIDCSGQDGGS